MPPNSNYEQTMNKFAANCERTFSPGRARIHTLFTLYSLTFGSACDIIDTESEGKPMIVLFLAVCVVGAIAIATM